MTPSLDDSVPLIDLVGLHHEQREAIEAAIGRVLESQRFILGPEVSQFETRMSEYLGGDVTCVGTSNGSDALVLALMALDVGPGDEVIVPAYTFVATASSVALLGARPVFVDVLDSALDIDPAAVARAVTPRTRAVIPVHLFGRAADLDALADALATAGAANVPIIEDAAQALGATYRGRPVGTLGRVGCLSFFPSKNLGGFGDGGMVVTPDPALGERLIRLRNQGRQSRYHHLEIGLNARLDALQAAVLSVRLERLDAWNARRRAAADRYRQAFTDRKLDTVVALPVGDGPGATRHTYNQFNLRVPAGRRDELRTHLSDGGIASAIYYPTPLPHQPCFHHLGHRPGEFPVSEAAAAESIAIPIHPRLTREAQERVATRVADFFS